MAAVSPAPQTSPVFRLFDPGSVFLSAFFGGPIAGASLMAVNYRRLGEAGKAAITLLIGIPAGVLILLLAWKAPTAAASSVALVSLFLVARCARGLQGQAIRDHVQEGGKLVSRWAGLAVGLAVCALLVGSIYAAQSIQDAKSRITIGSKDSVYYFGSATRDQAVALGNLLKADGYFSDRGVDVLVSRDKNGAVVSFITKEGSWKDPDTVSLFEELGRQAASVLGGLPIRVRMLNKDKEVEKESLVGKVSLPGNDAVYFMGDATEAQAQSLGRILTNEKYFEGRGVDVFLRQHDHAISVTFVVSNGFADKPGVLQEFEGMVRHAAPSLGQLPIELRLVNPSLETEKKETVS